MRFLYSYLQKMRSLYTIGLLLGSLLLNTGCAVFKSKPAEITSELGKEIVESQVPYLSVLNEQLVSGGSLIPRESVELSQKIGEGLAAQQAAHAHLFNRYFNEKRRQIDRWIKDVYVPELAKEKVRRYGQLKDNETLLNEVITESVQKRNTMQDELEKARMGLWEGVLESYTALRHANAELSALLYTVTDANKIQEKLAANASAIKPTMFDFSAFDEMFDNYLSEAGSNGYDADSLLEDYEIELPQEEE